MRYGILGGTFDPPHAGHLAVARAALVQLKLDEVILVPANKNPLKHTTETSVSHRLKMVELAVQDEPGLSVSDIEATRGGPSYMYETLDEFRMARPGEYWLVLGTDTLCQMGAWREPEHLLDRCRLAVVNRDDGPDPLGLPDKLRQYFSKLDTVQMQIVPVSSSKIREEMSRGHQVDEWLKPAVREYIEKVGLYR